MRKNKINVVVVDDDESFARALERLFRAAGFEVSTYPSLEASRVTRPVFVIGILRYLDQFLTRELKPGQTISREVAERWMASMKDLNPNTRGGRIAVLRQFCRYLSYFNRDTYIVPRSCTPRRTRLAPHIYTRGEVRKIMAGARRVGPPGTPRPAVVSTLIGLLYATGLRIGEAGTKGTSSASFVFHRRACLLDGQTTNRFFNYSWDIPASKR